MRFIVESSFLGTSYVGWQKQPDQVSVQSVLEGELSTCLRIPVEITGCGRTDSGVHARQYYFHFDHGEMPPDDLIYRLNKMLPADIALHAIWRVSDDGHARFSAVQRSYRYHLNFKKDPFNTHTSLHYPYADNLDFDKMLEAGEMLLEYQEFRPFCKTGSDTPHYLCTLSEARWDRSGNKATFTITSNRFLRGMVRLVVGMMLQVGRDAILLDDLRKAMESQRPLKRADSAPAHGLYLTSVQYPQNFLGIPVPGSV